MREQNRESFLYFIALMVSILLLSVSLYARIIYTPSKVSGTSMESTLHDGDILGYTYLGMKLEGLSRGDIVAISTRIQDSSAHIVKRIIGMPGETIQIIANQVYIDGKLLEEKYLMEGVYTEGDIDITLGPKQYFVMGDNRVDSLDSRDYRVGLIDEDEIMGIVINKNIFKKER